MASASIGPGPQLPLDDDAAGSADPEVAPVVAALLRGDRVVILAADTTEEQVVRLDRVVAALGPAGPRLIRVGHAEQGPLTLQGILTQLQSFDAGTPARPATPKLSTLRWPEREERHTILAVEQAEGVDEAALEALRALPDVQLLFATTPDFAERWASTLPLPGGGEPQAGGTVGPGVMAWAPRPSPAAAFLPDRSAGNSARRRAAHASGLGRGRSIAVICCAALIAIALGVGLYQGVFLGKAPQEASEPALAASEPPPAPARAAVPRAAVDASLPALRLPTPDPTVGTDPPPGARMFEARPPSEAKAGAPSPVPAPAAAAASTPKAPAASDEQLRRDFDAFLAARRHRRRHLTAQQRGALFQQFVAWRTQQSAAMKP